MAQERRLHEVVIVGAARTPIGAFLGTLAAVPAPRLGATAIKAALERAKLAPDQVKTVFMGEVLQGGVGQAPARQAALYAGIPNNVPCVTVNKVCGSGLESVIEGARVIALGEADVVVAGGMESMSNAPYFTSSLRQGARMGNVEFKDLMIHDGLWDPYNDMHMGMCGEKCAADFQLSRGAQDEYARESTLRAQKAQKEGAFKAEIVPVELTDKKGNKTLVEEPIELHPRQIARIGHGGADIAQAPSLDSADRVMKPALQSRSKPWPQSAEDKRWRSSVPPGRRSAHSRARCRACPAPGWGPW